MNLNLIDLTKLNESKITEWLENKIKHKVDIVKHAAIKAGRFYSFNYDSKLYEQELISFFDTTPLILVLSQNSNYILGLNFHYLPTKIRHDVISRLQKRYPKQWSVNKILPNVKWSDLKGQLKYESFMVKLYIKDNIQTIINISNKQMEQLVRIRSENFTGISPETVWKKMGGK